MGSEESCPGDVLSKPSQGCLKRTLQTPGNIKDVYAYMESLLAQHGYTTQNASTAPYANLQLGKWISDGLGSFTVRAYPDIRQPDHYSQIDVFLRQPSTPQTQLEITFLVKNGTTPSPVTPQSNPPPGKEGARGGRQTWMGLSAPPQRGTYTWAFQSVPVRVDGKTKYTSFYYEAPTGRSIDDPLPLPSGGSIVGVFPDDCTFSVRDQAGHSFTFKDEKEAKDKTLAPGSWSLFPIKCGGVVLFVK